MKLQKTGFILSRAVGIVLVFLAVGASARAQSCMDIFTRQNLAVRLEPTSVDGQDVLFHNDKIRDLLAGGITRQNLIVLARLASGRGTFDIPIDENGFVAAANVDQHHGNYGNYIWFRDFARTNAGLAALADVLKAASGDDTAAIAAAGSHSRQAARAMVRLLESPQWTQAVLNNLRDPDMHRPESGQTEVIWIRRLLKPFQENRPATPEETAAERPWGHKQNDAVAIFVETLLDAVSDGRLSYQDFSPAAIENLLLLPSYFLRLSYFQMWDVGAWEEQAAARTSSVALVTEFLERFRAGFFDSPSAGRMKPNERAFFAALRAAASQLPNWVGPGLDPQLYTYTAATLENAVNQGHIFVDAQLAGARPVETLNGDSNNVITRYEDTAILHMLWSNWSWLTTPAIEKLVTSLNVLQRPSGYVRYVDDWFLYGGAEGAVHMVDLNLLGSFAIPDQDGVWHPASAADAANIGRVHAQQMQSKDMAPVIALTGGGLEAQWTLPDSYLTQIYVDLYKRTQDPQDLERAKQHFARASALITGEGEFTVEGKSVEPWRLPEAYIPVRVIVDGKVETLYTVSPNSPLNWSTAEYIVAMQDLLSVLK